MNGPQAVKFVGNITQLRDKSQELVELEGEPMYTRQTEATGSITSKMVKCQGQEIPMQINKHTVSTIDTLYRFVAFLRETSELRTTIWYTNFCHTLGERELHADNRSMQIYAYPVYPNWVQILGRFHT